MSHLPEKGEAQAAAAALDARLKATAPEHGVAIAEVNINSGEMVGDDSPIRCAYGDLFEIGEVADLSRGPVRSFLSDIAYGTDPEVAMRSLFLMASAFGVLMERARWSR